MSMLSKVLQRRALLGSVAQLRAARVIPRDYESTRMNDQARHEPEPVPTEDEMIKVHYLKHHPLYEFKNFEELHVDPFLH